MNCFIGIILTIFVVIFAYFSFDLANDEKEKRKNKK